MTIAHNNVHVLTVMVLPRTNWLWMWTTSLPIVRVGFVHLVRHSRPYRIPQVGMCVYMYNVGNVCM